MAYEISVACPFYMWSEKSGKIHCEGGCHVAFLDEQEKEAFIRTYCGDVKGWQDCSLAKSRLGYYERKDREKRKRPRNAKGWNAG